MDIERSRNGRLAIFGCRLQIAIPGIKLPAARGNRQLLSIGNHQSTIVNL
jgi:hypothetical protein